MPRAFPVDARNRVFKHMVSHFYFPEMVSNVSRKNSFFSMAEDPTYSSYVSSGRSVYSGYVDTHATLRAVKVNKVNLDLSIEKCDLLPKDPGDDIQHYVDELVYQYFNEIWGECAPKGVGDSYDVNLSASPGRFYKKRGFATKGEALGDPLFYDYCNSTDHLPWYDYNGKQELLPIDSIMEDKKVRGTFNPQMDLLMKEKYLYDSQDAAIKARCETDWIKYGISKEYGGFHRIGASLQNCAFISEDDCSGYDRSVWLVPFYRMRNRNLKILTYSQFLLMCYVTHLTVNGYVLCPDGVLRQRATGNFSGNNSTTVDNSGSHVRVQFRLNTELFMEKYNRLPTLVEILSCSVTNIYSDDNISGYNSIVDMPLDEFYEIKLRVYAMFGLTLKPKAKVLTRVLDHKVDPQHSFLGSYFSYDQESEMYIPYPRVEKVCSSLKFSLGPMSLADTTVKAYALTVLSSMVPILRDECTGFLNFCLMKCTYANLDMRSYLGPQVYYDIKFMSENPRIFLARYTGRQSRTIFGGGRNKMERAAKAERKIKNICDSLGITPGGREWMDVALDPFKDIQQRPIGYPDANMARSCVQVVHETVTVVVPASAGTGDWDCNIFLDQVWLQTLIRDTDVVANGSLFRADTQAVIDYARGGLVVRSGPANSTLNILTTHPTQSIGLISDVFLNDTSARIIAIGLEVHNTTNKLNVQGAVITYRVNDSPEMTMATPIGNITAAWNSATLECASLVDPPQTATEAMDLPGSLQWEAEKGVYVVPPFIDEENPAQDQRQMVCKSRSSTGKAYINAITAAAPNASWSSPRAWNATVPIALSGAYFTGLSNSTELTVNLTYYVEQFPSIGSSLKRLAGPSCPEDVKARELYTLCSREMPTGVEVNDNFLGAFVSGLSTVMQTVARYAPQVIETVRGGMAVYDAFNNPTRNNPGIARQLTSLVPNTRDNALPSNVNNINVQRGGELVIREEKKVDNSRAVVPYISHPTNNPLRGVPRGGRGGKAARNKRDPGYNRMKKYMKASEAGNRWVGKM